MSLFRNKGISGVAFDIGTASISATVFELSDKHSKPKIIKTFRRFQTTSFQKDSFHFSKSTVSQFTLIMQDLEAFFRGKEMPTWYVVGLSSIFYLGKTERFFRDNRAFAPIKEAEINDFIEGGQKKFLSELKRNDISIFETVPMMTYLNGYPTDRPIGRSANEIELWVRFSATSRELEKRLSEIITGAYANAKIHFSTFPIVTWKLIKEMLSAEHCALLVDVGGELTEVTFVVNGVVTEILSLPFGVLNILLRLTDEEHIDLETAYSLLQGYTAQALSEEAHARVRGIIKKEIKTWDQSFEHVWQRATQNMMSNIQIFFLGGGALVDEMRSMLVPPLLHPDIAKELAVSVILPEAYKERFSTFCCLEGPGDFGLVALILNSPTSMV